MEDVAYGLTDTRFISRLAPEPNTKNTIFDNNFMYQRYVFVERDLVYLLDRAVYGNARHE
jgi:hypothetical protein